MFVGGFLANAGRRSEAHGQLEQRAVASRCNGESSKGSIEGNEERTSEEIATDQTEGRNRGRGGGTKKERRKRRQVENNTRTS